MIVQSVCKERTHKHFSLDTVSYQRVGVTVYVEVDAVVVNSFNLNVFVGYVPSANCPLEQGNGPEPQGLKDFCG